MSVSASLDSAISGLSSRVESARKAAGELARMSDKVVAENNNSSSKTAVEEGKGSFVDVRV